ncbi:uncharacterized protein LOC108915757 [Anoplophora glabripennis]|uniref:uncharacterized protein LOC108915757 n=1 Tax=Anoplophora glabripennis TaxID=217634 RepID=UPI000873A6D2|nr:uncharacterized protein LOC108915757 [Anoplophora glabripennis]
METTEVIIARLVLGYLKEEKCRIAYKEFLKTSKYLQGDSVTKAKYLPTRFVGLTLSNILCEYFELSKIVQGRLEATNYYNERHTRSSLIEQLLYLLNKNQSSRTSTPCPRSPLESNLDETSPSHIDHVSDVETTPAHTLPGNIRGTSEDSYLYKTPKRKSNSKLNKSATVANLQTTNKEDMSEVMANTLLENKEFHEKIAKTINKVAEKQYRVSSELDQTIKTVVKETEADPMFDKILEEIIGSTSAIENCSSSTSSAAKDSRDDLTNKLKRSQKRLNSEQSEEDVDQMIRTHCNPVTVEQQNDEAIRSIVANSNLKPNSVGSTQEMHVNNEVTVFNGSLDKYLTSNTCNANTQTQPLQNPLYINTGGLLMVPSGITSNGNMQIESTKQYYLVNKQSTVNWSIPPIQTTNIITEQDILAMPTVIVSDEGHNKITTSEPALQTSILTTNSKLTKIMPKPTIEIATEYLNDFSGNDIPQQSGLKNVVYPKATKKAKTKEKTVSTTSSQTTVDTHAMDIPRAKKSLPDELHEQDEGDKTTESLQTNAKTNSGHLTPPPLAEHIQKTPKSGSHVRNLDFSTPPKITSSPKQSFPSKDENNICVQKIQTTKTSFNSQNDSDKTLQVKEQKTWDSDLRAAIILPEEEEKVVCNKLKKKKKTPVKKVKKKVKKIKSAKKNLNTTEQNAALIEAALQTPVKTENRKDTNSEPLNSDGKIENQVNINSEETVINSKSDKVLKHDDNSRKLESQAKDSNECNTNKTVLSPSKLNASKRKLIKSDVTDNTTNDLVKPVDETNKFITPEMVKENFHYPIKANRNITALFETPLKNEFLPKTPGSPNASLNTPFTKMLEANLKGIDISCLPTPNIPVTPNFPPFTPNVEASSPYSRRTDYSTSSSYYHPSDSEPNRSLEANVIELEKQVVTSSSDVTKNVDKDETENREPKNDLIKPGMNPVDQRLKMFNNTVIGKKNLSLVKPSIESSSSSSDSSSESSSEEDWVDKSDETIIYNKKAAETPKRTYSLRNRTINKKQDVTKTSEIKEPNIRQANRCIKTSVRSVVTNAAQKREESQICLKSEIPTDTQLNCEDNKMAVKEKENKPLIKNNLIRQTLRKELNEKLTRTMTKIKNVEKPVKKNSRKPVKNTKSKFMKIKFVSRKKKLEKSDENLKRIIDEGIKNIDDDLGVTDSNSHTLQHKCKRKGGGDKDSPTKKIEKIDKSTLDIEAQKLIEGLKERGIHLMKNKSSPNKKTNGTSNFSELDKTRNNDGGTSKDVTENNCTVENSRERSTLELETDCRETYDTVVFEDYECIVFSESKGITKTFENYDTKVLEKKFIGKVSIEETENEIEIPLEVTPFYTLLDISSSRNQPQKQKGTNQKTKDRNKKTEEKVINKDTTIKTDTNKISTCVPPNLISGSDHINHVILGSSGEDRDGLEAPCTKKRKVEKEDCRVPEEKECKTLLQQINVDTFLNNIYGNS